MYVPFVNERVNCLIFVVELQWLLVEVITVLIVKARQEQLKLVNAEQIWFKYREILKGSS